MNAHNGVTVNEHGTWLQTLLLIAVTGLIVVTALTHAELLFWVALSANVVLMIWFLFDRKIWLACISAIAFFVTVLLTAKTLF